MFCDLLLFVVLASSPALTKVVNENVYSCSVNEFSCDHGACVSLDRVCDGHGDCADLSDEYHCEIGLNNTRHGNPTLSRLKRQTSNCRKSQWQCRDGTCIPLNEKCDGLITCADKSDETHALCRNLECQDNWFRCTYGACVDGTAPCNKVQDCADNSDELLARCRNDTSAFKVRRKFKCQDGSLIPVWSFCDGIVDCLDGSDETVSACGEKICDAYLFQCAYGACVDRGSDCNGIKECADGSDEDDELCGREVPAVTSRFPPPSNKPKDANCVLPPHPVNGVYKANKVPNASPGQVYKNARLTYSCNPGYKVVGPTFIVTCFKGFWNPKNMPECARLCNLKKDQSVNKFQCRITGKNDTRGQRTCNDQEPVGTSVMPICSSNYHITDPDLPDMKCNKDGNWDNVITCIPECGRVTPEGDPLIVNGSVVKRAELPWHVGIYTKAINPYLLICGGSIVRNDVVISAAHCFWDDKMLPAENYAVVAGKLYRDWNHPMDVDIQRSDVKSITLPDRYQGNIAKFQHDIAIVMLKIPFVYKTHVRPVCLDFNSTFDEFQLEDGKVGTVAGWGKTDTGVESPILLTTKLPNVNVVKCIEEVSKQYKELIVGDKICAGYKNGSTAVCKGDSGGGLAYPELINGVTRYYLRGIVSVAPKSAAPCNTFEYTTFTQILVHELFINRALNKAR